VSKEQLDRIETKVDKLDNRLDKVDVRLAKYNSELEFHVARVTQVEDELLPIAQHVLRLQGISAAIKTGAIITAWVVATIIALVSIYVGVK